MRILAYPGYAPGGGAVGFVSEYAYSFAAVARLVRKALRDGPFDVLQACNPPDIFWPIARWLRHRDGTRFVFDHHDLCPELYISRFLREGLPYKGLTFLERQTFRAADRVTSTNESYAHVARARGDVRPEHVTVVRTGPDPQRLRAHEPVLAMRRGRQHLVAYLGVMGPQDGVDIAVAAADVIVNEVGRSDITFTFMGSGDSHADLVRQRDAAGLADYVDLPGRVPDEFVADVLSTADVALSPDPLNPLNDVSTMNKTMEYMAFGVPVVAFDLRETRVSAGEAATYVQPNDVKAYARAIVDLVDDPAAGAEMGRLGRERVEQHLAWEHQQAGYVRVFDRARWQEGAGSGRGDRVCTGRGRCGGCGRRAGGAGAGGRCFRRASAGGRGGVGHGVRGRDAGGHVPHRGRGSRSCFRRHRSLTMCGIAGAWQQPDGKVVVTTMVERIAHRGPDASGVVEHVTPESSVVLGHRRLSIIDLSTASDQPFAKGGLTLSYNGEIYNYRELRRELESLGARFATTSDTEVVLEAWRAWGPDSLPRFRGMFAFAVYDEATGTLALARDPLGIKPLYVMRRGAGVVFASELKAIRRRRREPAVRGPDGDGRFDAVLLAAAGVRCTPGGGAPPGRHVDAVPTRRLRGVRAVLERGGRRGTRCGRPTRGHP